VASELRDRGLSVTYDDSGAIGRRYRRQDEVGTPFCVTVDYATIGEADDESEGDPGTVTVRERDTTAQKRVHLDDLADRLEALRDGDIDFADL
jgi:glycyl-tRNA synthetase